MTPKIETIAKATHEIVRAYCVAMGDESQPAWDDAPESQRTSACNGVMVHLQRAETTPEESHEAWMSEKRATGWSYGPVKNVEIKQHPCFLPYWDLPERERAKDHLFRAIVKQLDLFLP